MKTSERIAELERKVKDHDNLLESLATNIIEYQKHQQKSIVELARHFSDTLNPIIEKKVQQLFAEK